MTTPDAPTPDATQEDAPARRRRDVPLLGVVALALAVVVVAVWLLGGFNQAKGRLMILPAGTTVAMGPMEMSLTSATARQSVGSGWSVEVLGRCRNVTDKVVDGIANRLARNAFGLQDPRTATVYDEALINFGSSTWLDGEESLNPGLPPTACVLSFTLDESFEPADFVWVGISEVEFIDASLTGTGDLAWSATRTGYRFAVPLSVIAEG